MSNQVRLKIEGMSCGHCVKAVSGALLAVPGVESVSVDLLSGSATVVGGEFAPDALVAAVESEEFTATVVGG